jgi:hypothetical protein
MRVENINYKTGINSSATMEELILEEFEEMNCLTSAKEKLKYSHTVY